MSNSNACTPDNVIGKMLGVREANGFEVGIDLIDELDHGGKASYNNFNNQFKAEVFKESADSPQKEASLKAANMFVGDGPEVALSIAHDLRNPSGLFGEDKIAPIVEFITEHHTEHFDDIPGGRADYFEGIKEAFDEVDTDGFSITQQKAWNKYKSFYENGGELYSLNQKSGLEKGMTNLAGNVIKSSPTVIIGNVLEGTIKLPTLYPKTFLKGIADAQANGGLFKHIPELKEKGVYGINYAGEDPGLWGGLIGLTDVPLKNIAYYAGELADGPGGGIKAVQRVAFTPRFGDLPGVYYGTGGRAAVQFLSYTMNTYKMYGSLFKMAKEGNPGPLVTYHVLAGLVGGGAAAGIPAVGEGIFESLFPDSEEWFEENKGPLAKLVQPGNITKIGVGYDIANRQFKSIGKNWESATERIRDGETLNGVLDLADIGLNLAAFTTAPVGDLNIQKALRMGKEVMQGELDIEDVPAEAQEKYVPFLDLAQ
jgi:hypothetical protein